MNNERIRFCVYGKNAQTLFTLPRRVTYGSASARLSGVGTVEVESPLNDFCDFGDCVEWVIGETRSMFPAGLRGYVVATGDTGASIAQSFGRLRGVLEALGFSCSERVSSDRVFSLSAILEGDADE